MAFGIHAGFSGGASFIQRNLNNAQKQYQETINRLSSGQRINSGRDDPAGLIISEQLRAQLAGNERALRNTVEAGNVLSIAEGGLSSIQDNLRNMRSLAIHSMNDGITSQGQTAANQAELDSLLQTVQRTAGTTRYASNNLLDGSPGHDAMTLQLNEGAGDQSRDTASTPNANVSNLGQVTVDGQTYSLNDLFSGGAASLANNPQLALDIIDQAINDISSSRGAIGAYQANTLETNANNLAVEALNLAATESGLRDADMASEMIEMTRRQIQRHTGLMLLRKNNEQARTSVTSLLGTTTQRA